MKWTPAQEKELKYYAPRHLGIAAVAHAMSAKFGKSFSYGSVEHKARRLGIPISPGGTSHE